MEYIKSYQSPKMRFATLRFIISAPFIYGVFFPMVIFDLVIEIYHQVCFRLYGIPRVKRSDYIIIWDRAKLSKLNWIQKFNCVYCGYANGFIAYAQEIAARTEKFWCGIQHQLDDQQFVQRHHIEKNFEKFEDYK